MSPNGDLVPPSASTTAAVQDDMPPTEHRPGADGVGAGPHAGESWTIPFLGSLNVRRLPPLPSLLLLSACLLVWVLPQIGVPASLILLTLLCPVGPNWQSRASVFGVISLALVGLLVSVGHMPVAGATGQIVLSILLAGSLVAILLGRGVSIWPQVDWATAIWLTSVASVYFLLVSPTWGVTQAQALSSLWGGWDHSSHFAIFAELHQGQRVDFSPPGATQVMFGNYPSLYAQVWALLVSSVGGGPETVSRTDLILPYVWLNGATAALACGGLVVVASEIGRRLVPRSARTAASAAGFAAMLTCIVGGATQLSDAGHTNFLLAACLAIVGSWFALAYALDNRLRSVVLFLSACLVTVLLYPPTLAGLGPAGLVTVWLWMPRSGWKRALVVVAAGAFALALLDVGGVKLGTLADEIVTYARFGGGASPFNAMLAVMAPVLALAILDRLSRSGSWILGAAAVGPAVGLGFVAFLLILASRSSAIPITSSYYTLKMVGAVALAASVLVAALVGGWFADSIARDVDGIRSSARRIIARALAWTALAAVLVSAAGYFGPKGSLLPAGSPVAPGAIALSGREFLVRDVREGHMVLGAVAALDGAAGGPIMWDGGDLKNNRWVTSLLQPLTIEHDQLLSALPVVPLDQTSVPVVANWLGQDARRALRIAYIREETGTYLNELGAEYPGQVTIVRMSPAD